MNLVGSLDPQGPVAEAMAGLWWLMLALGVVVFVVFAVLLAVASFRSASDEAIEARQARSGRWILVWGVVAPAVIIVVVFVATVWAMRAVPTEAPSDALVIEVVGHQWWYEVTYPDQQVTTRNELHIPVGRPVALRLTSADVIHSFWVPQLGGKLDMLPDGVNTLVLEADEPGEHVSRCAEFCGLEHTTMQLAVVAESPQEFEAWLADSQAATGPARTVADRRREAAGAQGEAR